MRILGVDYGTVRIGLALSDPTGMLAQGLSVLKRKTDAQALADILQIIHQHGVDEVVVGLPRHMNGSLGEKAQVCQAFADEIATASGLPVAMYDERLTTVAAERMLIEADVMRKRRKQVIDAVAATLLLQGYLDRKSNTAR